MTKNEALLIVKKMKPQMILFVEHDKDTYARSIGRFLVFTDQGLIDITRHMAAFNEQALVRKHNPKKNCGVFCIPTKTPHSIIRDLSEELYGKWNKIGTATLEYNQIF